MPNFIYNRDVPDAPNNPSNDQPPMQENTNSIDSLINEDHYSFNDNNGGLHKRVRLIDLLAVPTGLAAGMGTEYTKLATSIGLSTESNLFYVPDTGDPVPGPSREYQLTRTITGSYAEFGTNTNYPPNVVNQNGGWTFLPGGLLLQYGTMQVTGVNTVVAFPITYDVNVYSITFSTKTTQIRLSSESASGFTAITEGTVGIRFYWMAIGK